jgi:hypothetical protein
MKLESIHIKSANRWDKFLGYRGEITFDGPLGKVQIQTGDELSRRILQECADEIVAASQQVAHELTASIIEQVTVPALEASAELEPPQKKSAKKDS